MYTTNVTHAETRVGFGNSGLFEEEREEGVVTGEHIFTCVITVDTSILIVTLNYGIVLM